MIGRNIISNIELDSRRGVGGLIEKKTYNFKLKGKTSKWKWLFETWFDFVSFGKKMWNLKLGLGGSGSGKKKKKREGCSFLIFFFSKNSFYLFNCVFLGPMPDVSFLLATMPCQPRVYDTPSLFLVDCQNMFDRYFF